MANLLRHIKNQKRRTPSAKKHSGAIPKNSEIKEAADKLGLENEVNLEAHFPKTHWAKTGMLLVEKKEAKEKIIQKIAKQLVKIKSQQQQLPANVKILKENFMLFLCLLSRQR